MPTVQTMSTQTRTITQQLVASITTRYGEGREREFGVMDAFSLSHLCLSQYVSFRLCLRDQSGFGVRDFICALS